MGLSVDQLLGSTWVASKIAVPKALALELEWSQALAAHFSIKPDWSIGALGSVPAPTPWAVCSWRVNDSDSSDLFSHN